MVTFIAATVGRGRYRHPGGHDAALRARAARAVDGAAARGRRRLRAPRQRGPPRAAARVALALAAASARVALAASSAPPSGARRAVPIGAAFAPRRGPRQGRRWQGRGHRQGRRWQGRGHGQGPAAARGRVEGRPSPSPRGAARGGRGLQGRGQERARALGQRPRAAAGADPGRPRGSARQVGGPLQCTTHAWHMCPSAAAAWTHMLTARRVYMRDEFRTGAAGSSAARTWPSPSSRRAPSATWPIGSPRSTTPGRCRAPRRVLPKLMCLDLGATALRYGHIGCSQSSSSSSSSSPPSPRGYSHSVN